MAILGLQRALEEIPVVQAALEAAGMQGNPEAAETQDSPVEVEKQDSLAEEQNSGALPVAVEHSVLFYLPDYFPEVLVPGLESGHSER
jgi:hypothetical protein